MAGCFLPRCIYDENHSAKIGTKSAYVERYQCPGKGADSSMAEIKILPAQKNSIAGVASIIDQIKESKHGLEQLIQWFSALQIKVDLPGIDEHKLEFNFADGVLTISQKDQSIPSPHGSIQNHIVAQNSKTQMALALAAKLSKTDDPVVLHGAVGTGKHLFARRIHQDSLRHLKPFVWLSCGTVSNEATILNAFEEAKSGTLYLDDLEEISSQHEKLVHQLISQPLQERDFRIIAATSMKPEELRKRNSYVIELLDLLHGCFIELLPLAERPEDIAMLANYHLERLCLEKGATIKVMSPEFIQMLEIYLWPGNVRELVNTLEQVLITAFEKKTLFAKDLPNHIRIQTLQKSAGQKKGL